MKQKYIIGVDISKSKIDCAIIDAHFKLEREREVANEDAKLRSFLRGALKSLKLQADELLVCCEHTGIYNAPLRRVCSELGIGLWEVQALKIKRASADLRGKSDRKDALRIADYGVRYNDQQQLYVAPAANLKELDALTKTRDTLVQQRVMINNQLSEAKSHDSTLYKLLFDNYKAALKALDGSIKQIEKKIESLINQDEQMRKNKELLVSIPGVGPQLAHNFILSTNNFADFTSAKQLACYAGVVPFENASGTIIKRPRVSKMANQKLKHLLHLTALCAIRGKGELQAYYIRKVQEGKNKMSVLNAIRNKIVHRIMAVITRQTPFINSAEDYNQKCNLGVAF